ncbi:MAG: nucleotidyltransferase family protein [Acidobacteria bacterium]|nr:nucleotidyltransferase family protein [Acidobacteriota bacterium]
MARDFQAILRSPDATYGEGLRFFRGKGMLNKALRKIAADLDRQKIDYVAVGAIALNRHGYRRFTEDIDLLMTRAGLERFQESLVGLGYRPAFEGARKKFRTTTENIPVEIIITGEFPGDGLPKPIAFPDPADVAVVIDGVKTITLEKLVELKLASGISAADRLKDLADVQELIKIRELNEDFAERLDPWVRDKYADLYRAVRDAQDRDTD